MAKDDRLYGKFTLDFADNPKILPLSDAAFRCLVEATLYSRRMKSDGLLATRLAVAKWGVDVLAELCENDPEKPSLVKADKGYLIRDYADHQDTREEIEARQARNKLNGSLGGQARAKRLANQPAKRNRSDTQAETETEKQNSSSTKKRDSAPRGSRLPKDWVPPAEEIARAKSEYAQHVNVRSEHDVFVDYWIAQAGAKGVRADWTAVWRNWMRRKEGDHSTRPAQKLTPEQRARQTLSLASNSKELE